MGAVSDLLGYQQNYARIYKCCLVSEANGIGRPLPWAGNSARYPQEHRLLRTRRSAPVQLPRVQRLYHGYRRREEGLSVSFHHPFFHRRTGLCAAAADFIGARGLRGCKKQRLCRIFRWISAPIQESYNPVKPYVALSPFPIIHHPRTEKCSCEPRCRRLLQIENPSPVWVGFC